MKTNGEFDQLCQLGTDHWQTYRGAREVLKNYSRKRKLRGSLPKSGPLDFATKNNFPLFFVGEEALVGVY